MHAVKGQNQQLFTKLALGNEMAASVKEISFFFFIQRVNISLLEENESVNKLEAILYDLLIYHLKIFQDGVADAFNKMSTSTNFSAHVMNINLQLPCIL